MRGWARVTERGHKPVTFVGVRQSARESIRSKETVE